MCFQCMKSALLKQSSPRISCTGIREFTDSDGKHYSALDVAAEYFRSGADKISIGSDAVYAVEEFLKTGKRSGV